VLLADRAVVLRDGRLASELIIDVPGPRRGHPRLIELREELLNELGVAAEAAA
jgi:sulfonate transport system ATP-binding protein